MPLRAPAPGGEREVSGGAASHRERGGGEAALPPLEREPVEAWPASPDAGGVQRVSRGALLAVYMPSLLPDALAHGLSEGVATRDSLGPVAWSSVRWHEMWQKCAVACARA